MKAVTQNCRSIQIPVASPTKPCTTNGIRFPMMMRYDTPTPKHFMTIAPSNTTEAFGYVNWDKVKNDAFPLSIYLAHRDWRYKPNPLVNPQSKIVKIPRVTPNLASDAGMARTPAPITITIG